MWDDGKRTIKAIGLDPSRFASHSAKRGGALAAAQAGLNDVELTRVGNWKALTWQLCTFAARRSSVRS
jgi:hypothetical protein